MAFTSSSVTLEKVPMVQYTMSGSWVSASARYLMSPIMELMKPLTMMPESTRVMVLSRRIKRGIAVVISTAAMPKTKASPCVAAAPRPSRMERAAPIQAPLDTPSMSEETSGLRNTPWKVVPARARAPPTSMAPVTRGRRTRMTPLIWFSVHAPSRGSTWERRMERASRGERLLYRPMHRAAVMQANRRTESPRRTAGRLRSSGDRSLPAAV